MTEEAKPHKRAGVRGGKVEMKALVVAAGIVFWTLVLGVAWLAFFPGSDSSEPVAILQIEPGPAADEGAGPAEDSSEAPDQDQGAASVPSEEPAAAKAPAASGGNMDMPPGFGVAPGVAPPAPMVQPPGPGQMLPATPGRQGAAEGNEQTASTEPAGQDATSQTTGNQQIAAVTPPPPPPLEIPAVEPGPGPLPPVPVAELVEDSQYGPLPKIASDGRRPIDVYARPSRYAAKNPGDPARVAILVNGLGLPDSPSGDVLKGLPPSVSVAYGAYGRSLQDLVTKARADGHEVLLEIPLEPNDYPKVDPGPHTLLTTLPREENMKRLEWLMSRYTGYVGITNDMGSKFEVAQDALTPVLEEVKARGLLYVDDGSVQSSTAGQIAGTIGLDYSVASVQIDTNASAAEVAKQLAKLEATAKEKGAAIGVVKAKPTTLKQVAEWAGKLQSKGLVLVPVSAAVRSQSQS
jgi:polysaccharide deacetylase 2 family uncharacterized protein YibQ